MTMLFQLIAVARQMFCLVSQKTHLSETKLNKAANAFYLTWVLKLSTFTFINNNYLSLNAIAYTYKKRIA